MRTSILRLQKVILFPSDDDDDDEDDDADNMIINDGTNDGTAWVRQLSNQTVNKNM